MTDCISKILAQKFTSLNDVPVTSARISFAEYELISKELSALAELRAEVSRQKLSAIPGNAVELEIQEMVTLIKLLVAAIRKHSSDSKLPEIALDFLRRKNRSPLPIASTEDY